MNLVSLSYAIKVLEAYAKEPRPFANLRSAREGFFLALKILRGIHKAGTWQIDEDQDEDMQSVKIGPFGPPE